MDDPADPLRDAPDGLSFGVIGGGSDALAHEIIAIARRVKAARADNAADFGLNVIFQVPGDLFVPDFEGVRLGTVFTAKRAMIAQVAVPQSLGPAEIEAFVIDAANRAIDLAEERVAKRRLGWSSVGLRATLNGVRDGRS